MAHQQSARSGRNPEAASASRRALRVVRSGGRYATGGAAARVFIVDDDEGVRDSLQRLLQSVDQSVESFASAHDFLSAWNGEPNCVLVLDVRMPEMSGLALQERLGEMTAVIPIVFITGYGDVPTAVRAMQNGAFDFIQKPFQSQDLLETIQRALAAAGRASEARERREREKERVARLTDREQQILSLMVKGKPNKVMAADLGLSQRTIEVHRAHVMKKLAVDSLAAAVRTYLLATGEPGADDPREIGVDPAHQP